MNRSRLSVPLIAVAGILLLIIIGEALILTSGHNDFSSSMSEDGCEISCRGSHCYDIVVTNGSFDSPTTVYVYLDDAYGSVHETTAVAVGARELTEESYADQLIKTLNARSVSNVSLINAAGLAELMGKDGDGVALAIISGSIPDTVYNGGSDSPIIKWIDSGGRLYWAGNVLGKYISHANGTVEEVPNGTSLFLGSECIDSEKTRSYTRIENGLGVAYSLTSNESRYSIDTSKLPEGTSFLSFGFTDGQRSSSCAVSIGDGMVCVIGGDYSDYQRIDMAQTIASGISPTTVIVEHLTGTAAGRTTVKMCSGEHAYVYLGGDLVVYAQLHEVS